MITLQELKDLADLLEKFDNSFSDDFGHADGIAIDSVKRIINEQISNSSEND